MEESNATRDTPEPKTEVSAPHRLLTIPKLKELQKQADKNKISITGSLWKFYYNDLYTDFEKEILKAKPSDCSIIEKYSQIETFPNKTEDDHLNEITLSTIYSDHPLREFHKRSMKKNVENADSVDKTGLLNAQEQLEKIDTLPLLVFIHGLGGQLSQFEPILQEFRNCSDIFGIELPGFGNSKRPSRIDDDEKNIHFARLSKFEDVKLQKLEESLNQLTWEDFKTDNIVDFLSQILLFKFPNRRFILISHSMGTQLSIKLINKLPDGKVESIIMMSPPKLEYDDETENVINRLHWKKRTFLKACSYLPRVFDYYRFFDRTGGLYSMSVENYIYCEEEDEDEDILKRLTQLRWNLDTDSIIFLKYVLGFKSITKGELLNAVEKLNTKKILLCCGDKDRVTKIDDSDEINRILKDEAKDVDVKFETINNANHSLFLDKPHLLAGVIYKFIEELDLNISCTWVLQVKAIISGDKWGLKNEVKWNQVITLSKPIINLNTNENSYLLGMKTLRQTDAQHNPNTFEEEHPEIYAVIDIGSDTPSYDPLEFKRIKYVKYKTESKVIPDNITIVKFVEIVDKLMKDRDNIKQYIVVHCHYGQNRTGFLICCYLIEKLGWNVNEAIEAFEISKPPGIKHVHFKNELHLRYNM